MPNYAVTPEGFPTYKQNRTMDYGKTRGGGVCFIVNSLWAPDVRILKTHCSPLLELLAIRVRPLYLPREFSSNLLIVVYIPPQADESLTLDEFFAIVVGLENSHPEAVFIVLLPAYKDKLKQENTFFRIIHKWNKEAEEVLQDGFDTTDWHIFEDAARGNNNELSDSVMGYVSKCIDDVVPKVTVCIHLNQKP